MPKRKRRAKARKANRSVPAAALVLTQLTQRLKWLAQRPPGSWLRRAFEACIAPVLAPLTVRRDAFALGGLFAATLLLYAAATPRTVMMEDDGIFILVAKYLGIAHPPGYPFYVLLSWLATWFPLESIAWRVHALSGLMGAVTCVCIAFIVLRRSANVWAACLAGGGLAVSEHFWSQALIADVYTTNTAMLFLTLLLVQEAVAQRQRWLWIAAAISYGLGLANHWPLLILATPMVLFYALAAKGDFWRRSLYLIALGLLVAAALYGWMVWRSHQSPIVNFAGSINTWEAFIRYVGRTVYSGVDQQADAGWNDKLLYGRYLLTQLWWQLSPLGALVAVCGVCVALQRGFRVGVIGEILAFACGTLLLLILLGFDYEYLEIAVFRPYQLVTYCIFALWFGYGLAAIASVIGVHRRRWRGLLWTSAVLSLLAVGVSNARINYRAADTFAADQALSILNLAEKNAIVVTFGDFDTPQLAYLHLIEGKRPDIRLMNSQGLLFQDRIVHPFWSNAAKDKAWNTFFDNTKRPIYYTIVNPVKKTGNEHHGYLYKLDADIKSGVFKIIESEPSKMLFRQLLKTPDSHDRWADYKRNSLIQQYGRYIGRMLQLRNLQPSDYIADILPKVESNYWSLMGLLQVLLPSSNDSQLAFIKPRFEKAKGLARDDRNKNHLATFYYLNGLLAQKLGDREEAKASYRQATQIQSTGPAHNALRSLMK